jgi:hypothetical protein
VRCQPQGKGAWVPGYGEVEIEWPATEQKVSDRPADKIDLARQCHGESSLRPGQFEDRGQRRHYLMAGEEKFFYRTDPCPPVWCPSAEDRQLITEMAPTLDHTANATCSSTSQRPADHPRCGSIRQCRLLEKRSEAPRTIWRKNEGKTLTLSRLWYTNIEPRFNPPVGEKIIVVLL